MVSGPGSRFNGGSKQRPMVEEKSPFHNCSVSQRTKTSASGRTTTSLFYKKVMPSYAMPEMNQNILISVPEIN